ncbi:E3 ubiquitin-protein ligase ARIH1 [Pseudolycoriella hygida]|uniref:RBR-type E3 ubiquitin transferase n=1 Tax=Pseudolycoriella hygida TaxID=35572 RepID=A0A9Q0N5A4_9DIPT|nr:E3 ubiquitin-protein ligase ARIH1 [Pseudolycoriella hygida]
MSTSQSFNEDEMSNSSFKVIAYDEVVRKMNEEIKRVSATLNVPPTIMRIILDRYNWNILKLLETFPFDSPTERDSFLRKAGVMIPSDRSISDELDANVDCGICYDSDGTTGLQCGHKFCRSCWRKYLTFKINECGEETIPCAAPNCDIFVLDSIVRSLISDPNVLQKYNGLISNKYVMWSKTLYWCKSPDCQFVIEIDYGTHVTCRCGSEFCCECYEDAHAPISCKHLKKWKEHDSCNQIYLSNFTKQCPKCQIDIEKNGGCPHMVCTTCKHSFCWNCLKPWYNHNPHDCNKTKSLESQQKRTRNERLRTCWHHYSKNKNALEDESQCLNIPWQMVNIDRRFELRRVSATILRCRRLLMYSYALIYYLEESNAVCIAESSLDGLEEKVDKLSSKLKEYEQSKTETTTSLFSVTENSNKEDMEMDVTEKMSEENLIESIVNDSSHCDEESKKLSKVFENGHDKSIWTYCE